MRVPTLHTSRQTFDAISQRQQEQAKLQAQVSSGLRVHSPGDDPLAAAQAEVARSRLARTAQDQRSVQLATSALNAADGALSQGAGLLQTAREALVAAGNPTYSASDRQALALQLRNTRDAMMELANTRDPAGGFVFAGQGSNGDPMADAPVAYAPAAGEQRVGEGLGHATTLDGRGAFLAIPQGNGVFTTGSAVGNTGAGWIDPGSVSDATLLTGHSYAITLSGTPAATYSVMDTTTSTSVVTNQPFLAGGSIDVAGQRVKISGTPATGDVFNLAPAGRQSVFKTLDDAITLLESPNLTAPAYTQGLQQVQTSLDRALEGLSAVRTHVGEELRGVDQASARNAQTEITTSARLSDVQDLDMARGISDLQASQSGLQAALKSYAGMNRQSLFELLG